MSYVGQHVATRDLGGLADDIVNIYNFLSYQICLQMIDVNKDLTERETPKARLICAEAMMFANFEFGLSLFPDLEVV